MVEAIVEFDYKAEQPDELTLAKGDIVRGIVQQDGGWWTGVLNGRKGVFPDNFVRLLEKKERRKCLVIFSYNPANSDELELQVDQEIEILEEVEEGWWKGRIDNRIGVFPSNFVKVVTNEASKKTDKIQDAKQENIKDKKSPSFSKKAALKTPAVPELCKVTFSYKAVNNDELTLQVGEIVTVLSKDTSEPGWWKGEINGRSGVFPDNFVELISSDATSSLRKKSNEARKKSIDNESEAENTAPMLKTPPLLPKKPKAPQAHDLPDGKKEHKVPAPEPKISLPESKLIAPATPPAASETKSQMLVMPSLVKEGSTEKGKVKNDFDSVPRGTLLAQPMRPKAPRRRPPSGALKLNGHSDSFDEKTDGIADKRASLEVKPVPKIEDSPKEALREPVKIEPKKSPFMEELKGAVNQVKKDKPPAKPRPLSVGLSAKAPPTSPRKSPLEELKPVEKPLPEKRPVSDVPKADELISKIEQLKSKDLIKPEEPKKRPVIDLVKPEEPKKRPVVDLIKPEEPKKRPVVDMFKPEEPKKALSLEERVKDLEDTVRRLASALREETRDRLRLEEEVERLTNRVVQI